MVKEIVTCNSNWAKQMHVSLAGPNYMKVSWMTASTAVPATVQYGLATGQLTENATGVTKSYRFLLYESGQMHHVVLGPLQDSTTYFYQCGGFGPEYNFTTPPPAGPNVPIKLCIVGETSLFLFLFLISPVFGGRITYLWL